MNINPIPEDLPSKDNGEEQRLLEPSEEHQTYQIFLNIEGRKGQHEISLGKEATVEEAMLKVLTLEGNLKDFEIEDLELYLSSKKGKVKDDFPAIDKSQKISKVNFNRFVIVHKNQTLKNW